jgi:hypothetical protein
METSSPHELTLSERYYYLKHTQDIQHMLHFRPRVLKIIGTIKSPKLLSLICCIKPLVHSIELCVEQYSDFTFCLQFEHVQSLTLVVQHDTVINHDKRMMKWYSQITSLDILSEGSSNLDYNFSFHFISSYVVLTSLTIKNMNLHSNNYENRIQNLKVCKQLRQLHLFDLRCDLNLLSSLSFLTTLELQRVELMNGWPIDEVYSLDFIKELFIRSSWFYNLKLYDWPSLRHFKSYNDSPQSYHFVSPSLEILDFSNKDSISIELFHYLLYPYSTTVNWSEWNKHHLKKTCVDSIRSTQYLELMKTMTMEEKQVDKKVEQVDKKVEQVDKKVEQVDKKIETKIKEHVKLAFPGSIKTIIIPKKIIFYENDYRVPKKFIRGPKWIQQCTHSVAKLIPYTITVYSI